MNIGFNNMKVTEIDLPDGSDYYIEGRGTAKSNNVSFDPLLVQSMTDKEVENYENIHGIKKSKFPLWLLIILGIITYNTIKK